MRIRDRIAARRVRRLREFVAANRCPVRPGLTHDFQSEAGFDPMSFGGVWESWLCSKCGERQ